MGAGSSKKRELATIFDATGITEEGLIFKDNRTLSSIYHHLRYTNQNIRNMDNHLRFEQLEEILKNNKENYKEIIVDWGNFFFKNPEFIEEDTMKNILVDVYEKLSKKKEKERKRSEKKLEQIENVKRQLREKARSSPSVKVEYVKNFDFNDFVQTSPLRTKSPNKGGKRKTRKKRGGKSRRRKHRKKYKKHRKQNKKSHRKSNRKKRTTRRK